MANQEQLEILKQGVDVWNKWRAENPDVEIDLSGADLYGLDLSRANLESANLNGANLEGANLEGANLEGAQFVFARLTRANLRGANLEETDLSYSNLDEADLDDTYFEEWEAEEDCAESLVEEIRAEKAFKEKYKISIVHARLLSKRFASTFLVQLYLPQLREEVLKRINAQFKGKEIAEISEDSDLEQGQKVRLHLSSPDIVFSDDVIKKLDRDINATHFIAKPKDDCHPGEHQVVLSITDNDSKVELESYTFTVTVTDFVFDHVSRPLLSKASSAVLGVGSLAMFLLTLMGEIDTTFGLTSGTVAGALASAVILQFSRFYQRPATVHMP